MSNKISITEINKSSENNFKKLFKNIVEYYPDITKYLWKKIPYKTASHLFDNAMEFLDSLSVEEKESILKLHPDLGGKLATGGKLTKESSNEQKSAGLDALTTEEKQILSVLNKYYKEKFGFPFVICARENNYATIKSKMEERLLNSKETEIKTGFEEVKKITKLRLQDLVTE